jgi:hypothetical protein
VVWEGEAARPTPIPIQVGTAPLKACIGPHLFFDHGTGRERRNNTLPAPPINLSCESRLFACLPFGVEIRRWISFLRQVAESEPLRTVNPNEAGQRSDDCGQLLKTI